MRSSVISRPSSSDAHHGRDSTSRSRAPRLRWRACLRSVGAGAAHLEHCALVAGGRRRRAARSRRPRRPPSRHSRRAGKVVLLEPQRLHLRRVVGKADGGPVQRGLELALRQHLPHRQRSSGSAAARSPGTPSGSACVQPSPNSSTSSSRLGSLSAKSSLSERSAHRCVVVLRSTCVSMNEKLA